MVTTTKDAMEWQLQFGSITTSAGSTATIAFKNSFSDTKYILTFGQSNFSADGGSVCPFVSGTRNISGCEMVGAASTIYDWQAMW